MMEFTPNEIQELYNNRANLKVNTKSTGNKTGNSQGNNSSSFTDAQVAEEPKKKTSWFGFGAAKKDQNVSAGPAGPSPKPVRR